MNKNYTLKELADIGAMAAGDYQFRHHETGLVQMTNEGCAFGEDQPAREAFTKAVLDAIGYELPKDKERESFERWLAEQGDGFHPCGDVDKAFAVWKAGREELRRAQMTAKEPPELVDRPLPAYGEVKTEPAWIPWEGGECPVSMNCRRLEVRFRDGEEYLTDGAYGFIWTHSGTRGDILAYRVWEG